MSYHTTHMKVLAIINFIILGETLNSQWNNFEHIKIDSAMMKFDDEDSLGLMIKNFDQIFRFSKNCQN